MTSLYDQARDAIDRSPKVASLAIAAVASLVLCALAVFHLANPFFYGPKWLKLAMYAIALLLPVIAETMVILAHVRVSDGLFLAIACTVHFLLAYAVSRIVMRAPSEKRARRVLWCLAGFAVYVSLAVFFLW